MAANFARRTLNSSSAACLLNRSSSTSSSYSASFTSECGAKFKSFGSAKPSPASRIAPQKLKISRLHVELGAAQSLMPLHSVTASALLTSLLSKNKLSWGCLSEGFASTL